ncbi:hypothetical protein CPC16_010752 [Podila verticillata]|nr:hypothetical protein BGZ52_000742 [Haplosporangium bisporale]KAF9215471.1 hypothetical protein BGZ59_001291 [Podila verticillata]KAF9394650.1 hypothetical protein CPC16_010752 [Podila verticillata]KAI9235037.1 MAG: hypothetical protein BYD32DRAFT_68596 [Podila humilis]
MTETKKLDRWPAHHDPPSLLSLPSEILHIIFSTFSLVELANIVLVSKRSQTLVSPYLWHTLKLDSPATVKRFLSDPVQRALIRNAAFVRSLVLPPELYHVFLPHKGYHQYHPSHFANLQSINLPGKYNPRTGQTDRGSLGQDAEDAVSSLFRQNPSLTKVHIERNVGVESLLRMVSEDLPNLEDLDIEACQFGAWTAKVLLQNLPESIKHVAMIVAENEDDDVDNKMDISPTPKKHPALESLDIDLNSTEHEELILLPFLETCPNLKDYSNYTAQLVYNPRIKSILDKLGIEMRSMYNAVLDHNLDATDKEIAAVLSLSSQWTDIRLQGFRRAGPLTLAALLDHGENVVVVDVEGCSSLTSKDLCTILSKCKHLQEFITLEENEPDPITDPYILGTDLIEVKWATKSLKEWSCSIIVTRSRYDGDEAIDVEEAVKCLVLQRQVYRKLAEQTGLTTLRLNRIEAGLMDEIHYQEHCLEISLISGLEALEKLKDLQELDVSLIDHRIGVPELGWMQKHWPNLRRLNGMFGTCLNPMPGAQDWILLFRPAWLSSYEGY